jgi:uncharacterized protein (DUF2336 family)
LEGAIQTSSAEKRVETLRRVTDLFLSDADRLNDEQIAVFDDVLGQLIKRIETRALAELSARLAPVDNAPIEVIRRLAWDDEITVAGPVLAQSSRLTAGDLIEVAKMKSQDHLLAISGRGRLDETVTDALLTRGNRKVATRLAANSGACFSETGFTILVKAGETDVSLAERIGLRLDLPLRLLRQLLLRATEAVRNRLLSLTSSENHDEIRRIIATISTEVSKEVTTPRDFAKAQQLVLLMQKNNNFNEATLLEFANTRRYEEMVAALSLLCGASIEIIKPLMKSIRPDGLLIPCKAAELKWPTVSAILKNRFAHHSISDEDLAQCKTNFIALSKVTAQRVLRFWQVRVSPATHAQGSQP